MTDENDRLKQARINAGFETAADAAKRMGIDYPTYAAHENGSRGFDKDQARHYASTFKINVLWLLYGLGFPQGQSIEQKLLALPPEYRKQVVDFLEYLKGKVESP